MLLVFAAKSNKSAGSFLPQRPEIRGLLVLSGKNYTLLQYLGISCISWVQIEGPVAA
jgi:hypothetical protein